MAFADEIVKLQRERRIHLDFSQVNNPGIDWEGALERLYGIVPDDYGPVPIKGTVQSFGSFARSVLNLELDLETPSITVQLSDPFNEWRVLAEPPSHLLLYRWVHLILRVMDDNAGYFDQRVAVGQIADPKFTPGKTVSLTVQLNAGRFLGESIPRRLISLRDFPRCPPENAGKAVPFIYGVMSNQVRTAEITPGTPGGTPTIDPCGELVWEDNFNEGTTFPGYNIYVGTVTKTPFAGPDGSQAATIGGGTGGGIDRPITATQQGCASIDFFASAEPGAGVGASNWDLHCDLGTEGEEILVQSASGRAIQINYVLWNGSLSLGTATSGVNAYPLNQFFNVRLEWKWATWTAPSTIASDGYIYVYINGSLVLSVVDAPIAEFATSQAVTNQIGFSGGNFIADNLTIHRPGAVPTAEETPAACTPSDTGTGPNMAAGAVRAILVDTGLTTQVSVQDPAPHPGGTTIDTSIEQVGTAFANERIGAGTIHVPTFFYVAPLMTDGRVGPLSPIMDLDQGYDPDYPAHDALVSWNDIATTPDSWIVWMFTDSSFHPVSNPTPGARVRIIPGTPYIDPSWPPANTYDYQVVFTSVDDGDPWEPTPPVGEGAGGPTSSAFSGYRYLLAGHYLRRISEVYVRRPVAVPPEVEEPSVHDDPHEAEEDPHTPEHPVEPESVTVEMQVLQQEGTDFVQEVIEINGNRYHTIRFFAAMQSDDCTTQYEVTANVEGAETNADGTGSLIVEAVPMVEHILLNWVFNDYRSSIGPYAPNGGRWYTDVPYAPGLLNHASFIAAQEASYSFVVQGYYGSGAQTEQVLSTQLLSDLIRSFGLDFYFDPESNAWYVKLFDPRSINRSALPTLRPDPTGDGELGIISDSFEFSYALGQHKNVIPFFGGAMTGALDSADTSTEGGYTASGTVADPESIRIYGQLISEPIYMPWCRDPWTTYSVAARHLDMVRYPPIYATCKTPLGALTKLLSSEILVNHPDGTGISGWTGRVCRIYRSVLDMDNMEVQLTLRDVDRLIGDSILGDGPIGGAPADGSTGGGGVVVEPDDDPGVTTPGGTDTPGAAGPGGGGGGGGVGLLFAMDYSSATFPNAGWADGAYTTSPKWSRARLATGGPSGQAAYQLSINYVPGSGASDFYGGQFSWGWRGLVPDAPLNGEARYYRFRIKVDGNLQARNWDDGLATNYGDKLLIVNNGCPGGNCRAIMGLETDFATGRVHFSIAKDGGVDRVDTPSTYATGTWLNVQLELRWSTSNGASNGGYKIWVNNTNYASPTVQRTGIVLNVVASPDYLIFGGFSNQGVTASGTLSWTHTNFEYGDTFDAGY